MTVRISHWYGRLGNNIQQCAVAIMMAQDLQTSFVSTSHGWIKPHKVSFGNTNYDITSKFFYWEGPYREVNLEPKHIYKNMREVCKTHVFPQLDIPVIDVPDDTIVIHIRSGDVFDKTVINPEMYAPNPLSYYKDLIALFDHAIVVTEPDNYNPIVEELSLHPKVRIQRGSVEEDFGTLLGAKNVANSGVGTFAIAAALCSQKIENFYCTDLAISEHLNWKMLLDTDVKVHQMHLLNYFLPGEWRNTDEQRQFILDYKA